MDHIVDQKLSKTARKIAEQKLNNFFTLPIRIDHLESRLVTATTPNYQTSEGQSHKAPSSPVEKAVIAKEELDHALAELSELVYLRKLLEETQPELIRIWDLRFRKGLRNTDAIVIQELGYGNRQSYFNDRDALLGRIADVFGLWDDLRGGKS
ncbi:hypothetical protein [Exiguobacterium sp. s163]|uniref:hypothetical protein n=1 Tax=Exiguobacterium sp. s163 TaxID=2751287 RepID=UPI001BEAA7C6|nr:hypothetical protein [Exiguobacterium sp. s163]